MLVGGARYDARLKVCGFSQNGLLVRTFGKFFPTGLSGYLPWTFALIETRFVCDSSLLFSSVLRNALLQHPSHPVGYNLVE